MSFSPIASIKKVWRELEEEETFKIEGSTRKSVPSRHSPEPSARQAVYTNAQRQKFGRVLKPTNTGRSNSSWISTTFNKIGKMVFSSDDKNKVELQEMKKYANVMIGKDNPRPRSIIASRRPLRKRDTQISGALPRNKDMSHRNPYIRKLDEKDFNYSDLSLHSSGPIDSWKKQNSKIEIFKDEQTSNLTHEMDNARARSISPVFNLPSSPLVETQIEQREDISQSNIDSAHIHRENEELRKRVELLEKVLSETEKKVDDLQSQITESSIINNESFERIEPLPTTEFYRLSPAKVNLASYHKA